MLNFSFMFRQHFILGAKKAQARGNGQGNKDRCAANQATQGMGEFSIVTFFFASLGDLLDAFGGAQTSRLSCVSPTQFYAGPECLDRFYCHA